MNGLLSYFVMLASFMALGCGKQAAEGPAPGELPVTGAGGAGGEAKADAVAPGADAAPAAETDARAGAGDAADAVLANNDALEAAPPLTLEAYEQLVLGLAPCALKGDVIDLKCPGAEALRTAMGKRDALKEVLAKREELGLRLLLHEAPAVRVEAVELLGAPFVRSARALEGLVAAFLTEAHPGVQQALIRALARDGAKHGKVGAMLIAALDKTDLDVRAQAIYALSSPSNKKLAGGAERLAKAAEGDADMKIRQAACEHAGKLGAPELIATYTKLTGPRVDPALQASCMKGLVAMWADYPRFENASAAAYKLTLKLLLRTPRSKQMPSWIAIANLAKLSADSDALHAWKNRARWFDASVVRKALAAVVTDPMSDELARSSAVVAIRSLGASAGEVEALSKSLAKTDGVRPKGLVQKAFEQPLVQP